MPNFTKINSAQAKLVIRKDITHVIHDSLNVCYSVTMEHYVGHCPLYEVYLIYMFQELAVKEYTDGIFILFFNSMEMVGIEPETFPILSTLTTMK
jgi:hypothetical protein